MDAELKSLKIDRSTLRRDGGGWANKWILGGVGLFALLGAGATLYKRANAATVVEVARVAAPVSGASAGPVSSVVLNATGYIVAAHKIQVASKVVGKVAWIGVDKGDRVKEGQVIVRLEDDEYRAQLQQAKGQLQNLQARLEELQNGSRPEEIATSKANVEEGIADLDIARINLKRTQQLSAEGVLSKQALDDAQAQFRTREARVNSLQKTYELVKLGPRREQVDAVRGQIEQAKGAVQFYETQLNNTVIRAPVTGTILERAVERGEFVTTSFVGERGAKGYVVSLADLNDLEVELDISQNDFNKLFMGQKGSVTLDAYPDKRWEGMISEMSPEADRQKATVQVKVKIQNPDEFLRPEMNAAVGFLGREEKPGSGTAVSGAAPVYVPQAAVRDGKILIALGDRVVLRSVKTGPANSLGVRVDSGLIGGEDVILNPPAELKDGDRIAVRGR